MTRTILDLDEALSRHALFLAEVAHAGREALKVGLCGAYEGAYIGRCRAPAATGYGGYGEAHEFACKVG